MVGKLLGRQEINTLPAGNLIYLTDSLSSRDFLIDTGASVSVFPYHGSPTQFTKLKLHTADGTMVPCHGERLLPLKFGSHSFEWSFQLAPVTTPIIGADFLIHFNLLVDMAGKKILNASTLQVIGSKINTAPESIYSTANILSTPDEIKEVLDKFPDVISSEGFTATPPRHATLHHISTTPGPPVFAKARRLDPDKLATAKAEFLKMEKAGIIRRSNSPWSSPLHMVQKKDGTWRPCGDYRRLNTRTVPDRYPLPNIADFSAQIYGSKVFSKLDLLKGYYQVPMSPEDSKKTAVITPFGLWEFLRLPFGLRNAGQTFQRMMDEILGDIPYAFVYVDDILVFSPNLQSHVKHLHSILELLREHGLTLNLHKCEFAVSEVEFLGHRVTANGCSPLEKHTSALKNFPAPVDKAGLQRFLGLINFYRKFIQGAAQLLAPLTNALKGSKGSKALEWSPEMISAFSAAKTKLLSVPTIIHPAPNAPLSLAVDASDSHVGGVLQQKVAGNWAPLGFFSRKLTNPESRYSAFDRELLAAYSAIRHFRFRLEGSKFTLFTDHKPLTTALFRVTPPWSARQQRHLSYIAEFTNDLVHLPGIQNQVADTLSRPAEITTQSLLSPCNVSSHMTPMFPLNTDKSEITPNTDVPKMDWKLFSSFQETCISVKKMLSYESLKIHSLPMQGFPILCDVSTGSPRPLVPELLRHQIFLTFHAISHPGIRATKRLISSRFVWPSLAKDISEWTKSCISCQRSKVQQHIHTPVDHIPVPGRRFSHVHIDIVGPLHSCLGYQYILTMIDRTSRWPEAIPLSSITAGSCAQAFVDNWVSRFGVPSSITTDRGSQFTSSVWTGICTILGIEHIQTTSFHPQSNGMIERFHRSLKAALRARSASSTWVQQLPLVMLGLRTVPKQDTGLSASEAVYGSPLCLPGEFLDAEEYPPEIFLRKIDSAISGFSTTPHHNHPTTIHTQKIPISLQQAEFVFIRQDGHVPPLSPLYRGPFKVLEKKSKYFKIKIGNREDNVSIDRLKAVISIDTPTPEDPPNKGRPKKIEASIGLFSVSVLLHHA